jgi:hypothetical protein
MKFLKCGVKVGKGLPFVFGAHLNAEENAAEGEESYNE